MAVEDGTETRVGTSMNKAQRACVAVTLAAIGTTILFPVHDVYDQYAPVTVDSRNLAPGIVDSRRVILGTGNRYSDRAKRVDYKTGFPWHGLFVNYPAMLGQVAGLAALGAAGFTALSQVGRKRAGKSEGNACAP